MCSFRTLSNFDQLGSNIVFYEAERAERSYRVQGSQFAAHCVCDPQQSTQHLWPLKSRAYEILQIFSWLQS